MAQTEGYKETSGFGRFDTNECSMQIYEYRGVVSAAAVAANTTVEEGFVFTGVKSTDVLIAVHKPTAQAGLSVGPGRVSSADTVQLLFENHTAAPITPTGSQTYKVYVARFTVV